jgi:hypothetical protein
MKVAFRPKTERWFNYWEGDCGKPINNYYKKGFWKRYGRKKYFRNLTDLPSV